MKVCFLMERRGLYDDRAYWKQAMALLGKGYEVHYLVISHKHASEEGITSEGVHYQVFAAKKYIDSVIGNYVIKKLLPVSTEFNLMLEKVLQLQPQLIHIVDLRVLRILDKIKQNLPTTKIIYDIREPRDTNLIDIRMRDWKLPFFLKRRYADYIQRWEYQQAKKCDYLLGVDDGIAQRIKKNLPHQPYTTLYNFTNLADKRAYIPLNERLYDAAYVGGLSELRGAKTIVQATQIIAKEFPNFKLLLLGPAHDPMLTTFIEQFVVQNELEENVSWIKGVPYQEVSDYYNQIKIGLNPLKDVPAHHEIIQIKLFEYMSYGIPIISSNFGAMQTYVEQNEVGECIPPNDPNVLSATIIALMLNAEKLQLYSQNGYKAVDEKYNWQLMEDKYLTIVNDLLRG